MLSFLQVKYYSENSVQYVADKNGTTLKQNGRGSITFYVFSNLTTASPSYTHTLGNLEELQCPIEQCLKTAEPLKLVQNLGSLELNFLDLDIQFEIFHIPIISRKIQIPYNAENLHPLNEKVRAPCPTTVICLEPAYSELP